MTHEPDPEPTALPEITAVAGYTPTRYGTLEIGSPNPEWVDVTVGGTVYRVSVVGDRDDWGLPEIADPDGRLMLAITYAIDDAVAEWYRPVRWAS